MTTITERFTRYAEEAVKGVEDARNALYVAVAERKSADLLESMVQDLAGAEKVAWFREGVRKCWTFYLESDTADVEIVKLGRVERVALADKMVREMVLETLAQGADDSWSGRGNDLKRAEFDALRRVARQVISTLDR